MNKTFTALLLFHLVSYSFSQVGLLDSDFSADGRFNHDFGFDEDGLNDMVIQPDGKIIAVGFTLDGSPGTAAMLRCNPDGSLDNSFNGTGTLLPFNGSSGLVSVAIDANNRIVAAGNRDFSNDIWVIRLLSNGAYDSTFSFDGQVLVDLGGVDIARDMLIQPDGKILVCAIADNKPAFIRLNSDGTLDLSFSGDGKATLNNLVQTSSGTIAMQSDGKVVAAFALVDSFEVVSFVTRLNSNGTQDNTYATNGNFFYDLSPADISSTITNHLIIDSDDRILIAGRTFTSTNTTNVGFVSRLLPNGALDNSFNGVGVFKSSTSKASRAESIACQNDGKYVVGFTIDTFSKSNMEIIRLLNNGTKDGSFVDISSFPPTNIQIDFAGQDDRLAVLLLQPNGRILAGGRANMTSDVTSRQFAIARLLNDIQLSVNNNNLTETNFTLYPNPASKNISIEINDLNSSVTLVELSSSLGQTVVIYPVGYEESAYVRKISINIPADIANGLYTMSVKLENGNSFHKQLIIADY